jgi:uncharacterized membrane protein required for colicin V production
MTWIDWVMVAFALFAALQGIRRGLWAALTGIVALLAAYLAASVWFRSLAGAIRGYLPLTESWAAAIAFLALFLVIVELASLVVTLRTSANNIPPASRALGLAVGAVRGMTLATALLVVVLASPPAEPVRRDVDRSAIAPHAVNAYRGGLRALAVVLPPTAQPFGTDDTRF